MNDQPVQRRLVGHALRRHRERLGYTLADAVGIVECDTSKLSRIETGQRGIRPLELRILLTAYGVKAAEQEVLLAAAEPQQARAWPAAYADVLTADSQGYLKLESIASEARIYDANRIPGLFQTASYARAIAELGAGPPSVQTLGRLAEAHRARQKAILGKKKPHLHLIIGEHALHRTIGNQQISRAQHLMLAEASATPQVDLQILPLDSPAYAAVASGAMEILHFAGSAELGVVRLAITPGFGIYQVSPGHVAAATEAFTQLSAAAFDPAESALLLQRLLDH